MLPLPVTSHSPHIPGPADDIRAAQTGDDAAFERLYRAHAARIHALALRLTGDGTQAEELVQDAFVRAWRKLTTFRGESGFGTWLHRLTVNVFLLDERGRRKRALREIPDEALDERSGPRRPAAADHEDRIDLERAIARLPDGARTAFVLYDIYGYSHDEIAAMSGVAASTIRVHVHRARRRLMEELDR
jgi:RNA polymerase sigma-70 factor (ECF subfamily)